MSSFIVVGHLKATSKIARDQILDQFHQIVQYSRTEEPDVLRYAITIPQDEADETSIYAIEEYTTQQVSDDHILSSPVQGLLKLFGSQPSVLAEPPKVYQFEYTLDESHFTRPEAHSVEEPFIVFATAKVRSSTGLSELIATWKSIVNMAKTDESSTLMYALVRDKQDSNQVGTIEAYKTEADFRNHCAAAEVGQLVSKNKEVSGEMGYVVLKLQTGWLLRWITAALSSGTSWSFM